MKKKIALITGANRGIGLAIVKGLLAEQEKGGHNFHIVLGCRNLEEGKRAIKEEGLSEQYVSVHQLNLIDGKETIGHVRDICKQVGTPSILVNNAGVCEQTNPLELTEEQLKSSLQVNTLGPFLLAQALLPSMIEHGFGRIVNVSSGWGSFSEGLAGPLAYSLSKASLNAWTKSLHEYVQTQGVDLDIKINSFCPGWVKTRMGGDQAPRTTAQGADTGVWLATLDQGGPSGLFFRERKVIEW